MGRASHKGILGFWVRGLRHSSVVECARHGQGRESGGDGIRMIREGCE